jgi:hypothetical protein
VVTVDSRGSRDTGDSEDSGDSGNSVWRWCDTDESDVEFCWPVSTILYEPKQHILQETTAKKQATFLKMHSFGKTQIFFKNLCFFQKFF